MQIHEGKELQESICMFSMFFSTQYLDIMVKELNLYSSKYIEQIFYGNMCVLIFNSSF